MAQKSGFDQTDNRPTPLDLDQVEEESTMAPAQRASDELIEQEGYSEEQAYEIALESGESWSPPLEDELTSIVEEKNKHPTQATDATQVGESGQPPPFSSN